LETNLDLVRDLCFLVRVSKPRKVFFNGESPEYESGIACRAYSAEREMEHLRIALRVSVLQTDALLTKRMFRMKCNRLHLIGHDRIALPFPGCKPGALADVLMAQSPV
jgi:hypothetical protein